jgi:hypothetical protein
MSKQSDRVNAHTYETRSRDAYEQTVIQGKCSYENPEAEMKVLKAGNVVPAELEHLKIEGFRIGSWRCRRSRLPVTHAATQGDRSRKTEIKVEKQSNDARCEDHGVVRC